MSPQSRDQGVKPSGVDTQVNQAEEAAEYPSVLQRNSIMVTVYAAAFLVTLVKVALPT